MPAKTAINQTDEHKARIRACRTFAERLVAELNPGIPVEVRGHDQKPYPDPIPGAGGRVPNFVGGPYIIDVWDAGTIDGRAEERLKVFWSYALQSEPPDGPNICVLAVPDDETSIEDAKRLWARVVAQVPRPDNAITFDAGDANQREIWAVDQDEVRQLNSEGASFKDEGA